MANTSGVLPNGSYIRPAPGWIPVVSNAIASWTLTGQTTATPLTAINIPPLTGFGIGPDSEVIIAVSWALNSSANAHTISAVLNSSVNIFTETHTTDQTVEWQFKISCRGDTQKQFFSAVSGLGASTNFSQQLALNFNNPFYITMWATLANAADAARVERYSVWVSNAPSNQTTRFQYGKKLFWGANSHFDDYVAGGGSITPAQGVAGLSTLGMNTMRMAYEFGNPLTLGSLQAMAGALQAAGMNMYCCLDIGIQPSQTVAQNYAQNYAACRAAALALSPLGVTMYECGNEMDTKAGINVVGDNGAFPSSFSNTLWPYFRATIQGAIDGVHSVPGCYAGSNAFTLCGIGASDMLWFGTAPDGSSGYEQIRWDFTAWHNYRPFGPLIAIQQNAGGMWMNIYEYISRQYQVPIFISEFNGQSGDTDANNAAWCQRVMQDMYTNRYKYNIAGCMIYQLWQGSPWSMYNTPGTLNNPRGTVVQSFISSNPDNGL